MCKLLAAKCLFGRNGSSEDTSSDSDESIDMLLPRTYFPSRDDDFDDNGIDMGPCDSPPRPELGPIGLPRRRLGQLLWPPPLPETPPVNRVFCIFCYNQGYNTDIVHSHRMNINEGPVICPYLRAHVCPKCGATGDNAHVTDDCPKNRFRTVKEVEEELKHQQFMEKVMEVFNFLGQYPIFTEHTPEPPNSPRAWFHRRWLYSRDNNAYPANPPQ